MAKRVKVNFGFSKKPKLQTYVIVDKDGGLCLCCLLCGRLTQKIEMCTHVVRRGDILLPLDRRKFDLLGARKK
jgi:hypothetical protein